MITLEETIQERFLLGVLFYSFGHLGKKIRTHSKGAFAHSEYTIPHRRNQPWGINSCDLLWLIGVIIGGIFRVICALSLYSDHPLMGTLGEILCVHYH